MSTVTQHPDAQLTLREAYDKLYEKDHFSESYHYSMRAGILMWEELTPNPPLAEITNRTVADFRAACLKRPYEPTTINGAWGRIRAILRRMGPVTDGNPWALEIIPRVPAMKKVKVVHRRPRRVSLDDLSRAYIGCQYAEYPRVLSASDWWRSLLVVAYTSGLRKADLMDLTWEQIDFEKGTLDFSARKTGKADLWPLHPVAIEHLQRIDVNHEGPVFRGRRSGGIFYHRFHDLQRRGGVEKVFGLHDIRRTGASEIERVAKGVGPEFLQHTPRTVSDIYYLNRFEELREAVLAMRLPTGFKAGPKMAERAFQHEQEQRLKEQPPECKPRLKPPAEDWKFHPGGFTFRGKEYRLEYASRLRLVELLARSEHAVTWEQASEVLGNPKGGDSLKRVHSHICELRQLLRVLFGLPETFDPIPCVSRGDGGAWTITIP